MTTLRVEGWGVPNFLRKFQLNDIPLHPPVISKMFTSQSSFLKQLWDLLGEFSWIIKFWERKRNLLFFWGTYPHETWFLITLVSPFDWTRNQMIFSQIKGLSNLRDNIFQKEWYSGQNQVKLRWVKLWVGRDMCNS